jgi:acyl carrier protein
MLARGLSHLRGCAARPLEALELQDIISEVRAFLREFGTTAPADEDTSFMDNQVLDSAGFIGLIGFIEERYAMQVGDEEMLPENFDSLRKIERYIESKRGAARP